MDPHKASLLLNSRLRFNPTPTFLGVTFNRTLSFSKHVFLLKAKFFPHLKALRCISASSWSPFKKSLSLLYKAFLRPIFNYASPGWFPFLSVTNITKLERLHRAASRAISSCLSSSGPILLLLSEASLPPLRVTLTYFALSSCERTGRFPAFFPISGLARLGVKPRLQIVLHSFCIHSPDHASFFFFWGGSSCLPSLSSLKLAFLHCGVHFFLFTVPL